jgi:hypothetical protein
MDGTSVVTGVVSGILSAVLTYFVTRSKMRLELRADYDKHLHNKRLELYTKLWPKTRPLARFAPRVVLTHRRLQETSDDMRDWYFGEGGIYLSRRSRKPYFLLKAKLQEAIENDRVKANPDAEIDPEMTAEILQAATSLRTSLADDIGARMRPWL